MSSVLGGGLRSGQVPSINIKSLSEPRPTSIKLSFLLLWSISS
jgi:hypothetical protein